MASSQEMRDAVKKIGQFPKQWGARVDAMPDAQVAAIYAKLKAQKKL